MSNFGAKRSLNVLHLAKNPKCRQVWALKCRWGLQDANPVRYATGSVSKKIWKPSKCLNFHD